MGVSEITYYGDVGFLYPYDIRYDPADRAFCDILPDGRVRFRLWTEPGFSEAILVYRDNVAQGAPMRLYAEDTRYRFWEAIIQPFGPQIAYSFALRAPHGHTVYWCQHGVDHAVETLDRWTLDVSAMHPFSPPDWAKGAVIYQVFPERFANGEPANDPPKIASWGAAPAWLEFQGGDLQGITQHLDYLADLGVDILYLTPIFASPSTHKYDTMDYYHVDEAFGGDAALRELVDGVHRRDMKIILDASFNHCHPRFFAFQDLIHNGRASRYSDWFTVYDWPVRVKVRPNRAPAIDDHRRSTYAEWLEQVFPVESGVPLEMVDDDGPFVEPTYLAWSGVLDMPKLNQRNPKTRAYFMDVTQYWLREFGIDGWRMDVARHIEPDFWVDFRRAAKTVRDDCFLLSEIWGNTSPWLQGDQFDATMNYIFRDLCVDYFARGRMSTSAFLDGVTRMLSLYAPQVMAATHNLLSSHDVARFRHEAGEDIRRLMLATFFQLTFPGAPGIYYGDEIGMTGACDPDCRRAFPWQERESWDRNTLALSQGLIALRRAHPALRLGDWRLVHADGDVFAFERTYEGERVLVVVNRGDTAAHLEMPAAGEAAEVLWGDVQLTVQGETLVVDGPGGWSGAIVKL